MTAAVPKVAAGVTRGLFTGDLQRHWGRCRPTTFKQVALAGAGWRPLGRVLFLPFAESAKGSPRSGQRVVSNRTDAHDPDVLSARDIAGGEGGTRACAGG